MDGLYRLEQECQNQNYSKQWIIANIVPSFLALYQNVKVIKSQESAIPAMIALSHIFINRLQYDSRYGRQLANIVKLVASTHYSAFSAQFKSALIELISSAFYMQNHSDIIAIMEKLFSLPLIFYSSKFAAKKLLTEYPETIPVWKKLAGKAKKAYGCQTNKLIFEIYQNYEDSLFHINSKIAQLYEGEQEMKNEVEDNDKMDPDTQQHIAICESIVTMLISASSYSKFRPLLKHFLLDKHFFVLYKCSAFKESKPAQKLNNLMKYLKFLFHSDHENMPIEEQLATTNSFFNKIILLRDTVTKDRIDKYTINSSRIVGKICERKNLTELLDSLNDQELSQVFKILEISSLATSDCKMINYRLDIRTIKQEIVIQCFKQGKSLFDSIMNNGVYPIKQDMPQIAFPLEYSHRSIASFASRTFFFVSENLSKQLHDYITDISKAIKVDMDKQKKSTNMVIKNMNALKIDYFSMAHITQPSIGNYYPAEVRIDITVNIQDASSVWRDIKIGDFLYLCKYDDNSALTMMRGCQVLRIYNDKSEDIEDPESHNRTHNVSNVINIHALVDPVQYKKDISSRSPIFYNSMQIVIAVPKQIKAMTQLLMQIKKLSTLEIPEESLLNMVISANHTQLLSASIPQEQLSKFNLASLMESQSQYDEFISANPCYQNVITPSSTYSKAEDALANQEMSMIGKIMSEGISIIDGASKEGNTKKTIGKAIDIMLSCTNEKVLIITKSKGTLENMLSHFQKATIENTVVLGKEIKKYSDLYTHNKVDYLLKRRMCLMQTFLELAYSIEVTNFQEYTCERALSLFNYYLSPKWQCYLTQIKEGKAAKESFPFTNYFIKLNATLFGEDDAANQNTAAKCWATINGYVHEIHQCQPLEIIRDLKQRIKYVIGTCSRIIISKASTFAKMRERLKEDGILYSSLIIYGANEISDVEGIAPLTLNSQTKLNRVVLIGGSHHSNVMGYSILERFAMY